MRLTFWLSIGLLAVALSACAPTLASLSGDAEGGATPFDYAHGKQVPASPTPTEAPTPTAEASATPSPMPSPTPIPTTPPTLLPEESPPVGAEREFSTDFSKHSVPYSEILSGGPPKDGIPAIDEPKFVSVEEADEWLKPQEPVVLVELEDNARAYPIQILMWHEIVNDTVGSVPISVTFCPLCSTAIAFERTLDGQVLDFGTTGRLRFSNLIMFAPDDPRIVATMQAVRDRLWIKTEVGGVARYENDYYYQVSQDIENVPGNPWFICTLWLAQWYIATAQTEDDLKPALDILNWAAEHALPSGVMAEQVYPYTNAPLSVSPLTWSHATLVMTVLEYMARWAAVSERR